MKIPAPPCPACGGEPEITGIRRRHWAHFCPRANRTLWWATKTGGAIVLAVTPEGLVRCLA